MMRALEFGLRTLGFLVLFTVLGQVPIKGQSLENRYHELVNSEPFQKAYWTLAAPFTWSMNEVREFVHQHTSPGNSSEAEGRAR